MTPIFYVKNKEIFDILLNKYGFEILNVYNDEHKNPLEYNPLIHKYLLQSELKKCSKNS